MPTSHPPTLAIVAGIVLGQNFMDVLIGAGVAAGAIVAILTLVALVARLPPVRWLWRQLISGPLERFTTRIVRDGATQFHVDVVKPQMDDIQHDMADLKAMSETSWHKDKAWIVSRITKVEELQRQLITGVVAVLKEYGAPTDETNVIPAVLDTLSVMLEPPPKDGGTTNA